MKLLLQALAGLQTAEGQQDFRRELQRLQQQLEVEQDYKQNMQVQYPDLPGSPCSSTD